MKKIIFPAIMFFLGVEKCDASEWSTNFLGGIQGTTEHTQEPSTPYHEKNYAWLVEFELHDCVFECSAFSDTESTYIHHGGLRNSFNLPTIMHGVGRRACNVTEPSDWSGLTVRGEYCWAMGALGMKGYENTPNMFDGFAYALELNHQAGLNMEIDEDTRATIVVRNYWLLNGVTTSYAGFSFKRAL